MTDTTEKRQPIVECDGRMVKHKNYPTGTVRCSRCGWFDVEAIFPVGADCSFKDHNPNHYCGCGTPTEEGKRFAEFRLRFN